MGENHDSSFLYGYASSNRFYGSPEPPFNPKAVTQASWTRPEPKPELKGPLVDHANTLPDVVCALRLIHDPQLDNIRVLIIYASNATRLAPNRDGRQ